MVNSRLSKVKIISSLPGRLRASIWGLLRNEQMAFHIRNMLTKSNCVLSVRISINTGNVLIYYDTKCICEDKLIVVIQEALNYRKELIIPEDINKESLVKIMFNTLNPISLFKRKYSEKIYKNEYLLSKKILNISVVLSSIIFLFTSSINKVLSTLILGYPGILFAIGATSYYYGSAKLKQKNIYLKNNDLLSFLSDTNALLIENDILQSKLNKQNVIGSHLSKDDIQKLIILGELDNPINNTIESIVNDIRILGINNIFIIGDSTNSIINYISYYLGINVLNIDNIEKQKQGLISNNSDDIITLITTDEFFEKNYEFSCYDLIICVYKNNRLNLLKADINLEYTDIDKLPLIVKFSHFCREVNVQTENTAIALNTLGMILAVLNYSTPLYSTIFYGLNILLMTLKIKLKFMFFEKNNKGSYINHNQLPDYKIMHKELIYGK
ncbi:HMA2 domain-containing protein [Clostridium sp. DJ247]|uniref:HMA2 domain-containing protein n=1 Tax=Clostridium sp. DJ247 TaxID=2726188 RepID=UPI00162391A5|nr:hypothetical protein [Clostridium sp. DJ247]MBC2581315.1 hypothetical protein [Clostridium sp. DJ247]